MTSPKTSWQPALVILMGALLLTTPGVSLAQGPASPAGVSVVFMTGFLAGANPGLQVLQGKLQLAFAALPGQPLSSQVFTYADVPGAFNFVAAQAPGTGKLVLVGHSWGAEGTFNLAQNFLASQGINVDLAISIDYVSTATPFLATSPTTPASILRELNYHQVSTGFLEPVPSFQINGAQRNLNVEVLLADTSITHTTIDCDARVHELVIARILELVAPRLHPGTAEDLDTLARIDALNVPCQPAGGIATPGVLADHPVQLVSTGNLVTLRAVSPEGLFSGAPAGVLGEIFPTSVPPAGLITGIASSLTPGAIFLITPSQSLQLPPFLPSSLPVSGFTTQFCWPANLQGTSILFQAIVLDASANNAVFATSPAIELQGI